MIEFEEKLREIYLRHLRQGDTAVDAGAHVGDHTLPILERVGAAGYVLAFEPLKPMAEILKAKLKQYERKVRRAVDLHVCALGVEKGKTSFVYVPDAPYFSGFEERTYDQPRETQTITVEVKRLDDFEKKLRSLDYIKIDTEGGELLVLRGGEKCLRRFRPLVSIEFGMASAEPYGITPGDMHGFLTQMEYRVFDIMGRELDEAAFTDSSTRQELWDYIAVPKERADLPATLFP